MDDSILARLKSMGVKLGVSSTDAPPMPKKTSLEELTGGQIITNIFGECLEITRTYPVGYPQGDMKLHPLDHLGIVSEFYRSATMTLDGSDGLIFLDTETTGLSASAGTLAFLVGLCELKPDETHVRLLIMRSQSEEKALLARLTEILHHSSGIVTYNGISFDIPLLQNRYAFHRIQNPFIQLPHIDLLPLSRRLWKNTLPSRSLSHLEMAILGVARSSEEVPGYLIPQLYYDYLRTGDTSTLVGVLYHNEMDILSLAALLVYFANRSQSHEDVAVLNPQDNTSVISILMASEKYEQAWQLFSSSSADSLLQFEESTIRKLADFYKRNGRWERAVSIWEMCAQQQINWSILELSMYYEYRAKDYQQAIYYAELLIENIKNSKLAPFSKKRAIEDASKRIARLEIKSSR